MDKLCEAAYTTIVDQIVKSVWERYPEDLESRLYLYDRIAEGFAGMARVLRVEKSIVKTEPIPQIERTEEPENEESST